MAFRILTVGDVHGRSLWKTINSDDYDLIIFLGDYVDSYTETDEVSYNNFKEIIEFSKSNLNKVKLLLGNHDVHYILLNTQLGEDIKASRFSTKYALKLFNLYMEHIDLFSVAYEYKSHLWTHAGLSNSYYKRKCSDHDKVKESLSEYLNNKWKNLNRDLFDIGYTRGGNQKNGGILWADISETRNNPLKGYHQIVGHNIVKDIFTNKIDDNTSITYVDCPNIKFFKETIL